MATTQETLAPSVEELVRHASALEGRLKAVADIVNARDDDLSLSIQHVLGGEGEIEALGQDREQFAVSILERLVAHPAFPFIAKRLLKHEINVLRGEQAR